MAHRGWWELETRDGETPLRTRSEQRAATQPKRSAQQGEFDSGRLPLSHFRCLVSPPMAITLSEQAMTGVVLLGVGWLISVGSFAVDPLGCFQDDDDGDGCDGIGM